MHSHLYADRRLHSEPLYSGDLRRIQRRLGEEATHRAPLRSDRRIHRRLSRTRPGNRPERGGDREASLRARQLPPPIQGRLGDP